MSYNKAIPAPTDLISNSQADLLANFASLNTQFGVDHTAFETGAFPSDGDGFHKKVTITPVQGADPAVVGGQGILYTKTVSAKSQLFYENATQVSQIGGPFSAAGTGYVTLFGGILMQWAQGNFSGGKTATPSFTPNFSGSPWLVTCTMTASPPNIQAIAVTGVSGTGFTANVTNNSGQNFYWVAIGPQ